MSARRLESNEGKAEGHKEWQLSSSKIEYVDFPLALTPQFRLHRVATSTINPIIPTVPYSGRINGFVSLF